MYRELVVLQQELEGLDAEIAALMAARKAKAELLHACMRRLFHAMPPVDITASGINRMHSWAADTRPSPTSSSPVSPDSGSRVAAKDCTHILRSPVPEHIAQQHAGVPTVMQDKATGNTNAGRLHQVGSWRAGPTPPREAPCVVTAAAAASVGSPFASLPEPQNVLLRREYKGLPFQDGVFGYLGVCDVPQDAAVRFHRDMDSLVQVTASSVRYGDPRTLVMRRYESGFTRDVPGSWVCVAFLTVAVKPEAYTWSTSCAEFEWAPRNWQLQGSNGGAVWDVLSNHKDDLSLSNKEPGECTWRCESARPYRMLRLYCTDVNAGLNHRLVFGNLEFFGTIHGSLLRHSSSLSD